MAEAARHACCSRSGYHGRLWRSVTLASGMTGEWGTWAAKRLIRVP